MAKAQKITVDRSKIRMAIETGVPLSITTYTIPHGVEVYMTEVLTVFLTELNQKQMIEYLILQVKLFLFCNLKVWYYLGC